MKSIMWRVVVGTLLFTFSWVFHNELCALEQNTSGPKDSPQELWMQVLPVPNDSALREEMQVVQDKLGSLYTQIGQHKETLQGMQNPSRKTQLSAELERIQREYADLTVLLEALVEDARASEQTEVDRLIERDQWAEQQREYQTLREEIIRDR
jgi:dephospho-CoA kinase